MSYIILVEYFSRLVRSHFLISKVSGFYDGHSGTISSPWFSCLRHINISSSMVVGPALSPICPYFPFLSPYTSCSSCLPWVLASAFTSLKPIRPERIRSSSAVLHSCSLVVLYCTITIWRSRLWQIAVMAKDGMIQWEHATFSCRALRLVQAWKS